jgi:predicted GNAT family acetyltransferase
MKFLRSYKSFESNSTIQSKSFNEVEFEKFLSDIEKGDNSDDIENRIRFFKYPYYSHFSSKNDPLYSIILDDEKVIGVCKISSYKDLKENEMEISYCSIDRDYRGKGYLNILVEEMVSLCKDKGFSLGASRWTVPGYLKLRPTVKKWTDKYNVEFRDHNLKFDFPSHYNSELVNVNEMTPEELEEFQKLKRVKPKYKGIFKHLFYDTGKHKIYSTQTQFDKGKINEIYKDIKDNNYDYFSKKGKIAGYYYKDKYYITEGHHRILAALKYWRKYNDYQPVDKMIKNGIFEEKNPISEKPRKFPIKMMESLIKSQ